LEISIARTIRQSFQDYGVGVAGGVVSAGVPVAVAGGAVSVVAGAGVVAGVVVSVGVAVGVVAGGVMGVAAGLVGSTAAAAAASAFIAAMALSRAGGGVVVSLETSSSRVLRCPWTRVPMACT
jgi:hypothetical protein